MTGAQVDIHHGAAAGIAPRRRACSPPKAGSWCQRRERPEPRRSRRSESELGADRVSHPRCRRARPPLGRVSRAASPRGPTDACTPCCERGRAVHGQDQTITPAQKDLLVDVNVKGVIHTIDAAFPFLVRTPGAHVIAMTRPRPNTDHRNTRCTVRRNSSCAPDGSAQHRVPGSRRPGCRRSTSPTCRRGLCSMLGEAGIDRPARGQGPAQRVAGPCGRRCTAIRVHWHVGLDARLINFAARCSAPARAVYRMIMSRLNIAGKRTGYGDRGQEASRRCAVSVPPTRSRCRARAPRLRSM